MIGSPLLATPAGLEPVTSAVTGRRSNQLSYGAVCFSLSRGTSGYITRFPAIAKLGVSHWNPRFTSARKSSASTSTIHDQRTARSRVANRRYAAANPTTTISTVNTANGTGIRPSITSRGVA